MEVIYGHIQPGYLTNQDLIKNLAPFGYFPSKKTPCLWHHKTRPIKFTVVMDDLEGRYVNKEYAQYLLNSIEDNYPVKVDWTGKNTLELT